MAPKVAQKCSQNCQGNGADFCLIFNKFWSHFGFPKQRYPQDPFLKVFQGGSKWPILAHLGALLAPSWSHLGPILAPCWPMLAPSSPHLVPTLAILAHLGAVLAPSCGHAEPSWAPSWARFISHQFLHENREKSPQSYAIKAQPGFRQPPSSGLFSPRFGLKK